jgi:peptide/nickel transport system substrate-binding protein
VAAEPARRRPDRRVRLAMEDMMYRRVCLLGLVLSMTLASVACAPAAPPPAKPDARVVATIALPGVMVESLNPYGHSTTQIYPTWKHVIEPLVEWSWEQKDLVPVLAESWSNPDSQTWLFKLKQGVRFHDGGEFTADDVVHSYTRILKDPDSKQASSIAGIDDLEAVDRYTVRIHTKAPDAALLFRLSQRFITSKAVYDRLGAVEADKLAIGTGPYKFKEWVSGQRFVLEKNPNYPAGPRQPTVDEVVFRNIPEAEAAITALLNREVDVITNVPPESVERLSGNARRETVPTVNIMFMGLHSSVPQFKDKLVRQAVTLAVDKEALTRGVLKGFGTPMDAPIGPMQYGYSAELQPKLGYDPQRARQLLAQAGYPNGFDVEFVVPLGQYNKIKEIAEATSSMLADVGIRTRITTQDQNTGFTAIQQGKAPLYVFGRGSVIDPSEYLHQYFHTGVTKRIEFSSPEADAALDAEQGAFDPAERVRLLRRAMSVLMDEAPAVWLFQYQGIEGVSNRFDYTPNPNEDIYAWDLKPRR